ncbi:alpha/beta hydrolase [Microbacterium oxydans]|uniref:alpha/beta fold hydrolase n=1 Tax=Microbacterium sp. B19(2022) TaxID=2914045 RepID=UPI00142FB0FC|nr:alpha/beta hydrolase [Microbacterium sp. B19(2022)]NJI58789.1 alpha/beta hydrolase [Microbacterium sp. B19(2022)]
MDARRTIIDLPHATVSALEWRPTAETGLPVLLLHGGGADSAELSWGEVGPALAQAGHRVVAPDLPGFGHSPRTAWPLTQELLVRHVGELVDALDLTDYAIAGLSLGGGMTVGHLLDQPGRARTAVLLGCYGLMPRLADGFRGRITHLTSFLLLRSGLLAAMTRSYARNRSALERGLRDLVRNPEARTPELVDAVLAEAAGGTSLETFGEWQRDQVLWNRLRTVYTDQLAGIRTPTLLVHGDRDTGVPLARIETAAALLPSGSLRPIPGAGHWVQRDRPDLVIPAMLEQLRRDDASTARS